MTVIVPTSEFFTTSSGTKLHFLQVGPRHGTLLLCLHGLGGSSSTFLPLLTHLPPTYHTILIDFPGFGSTPTPPSTQTLSIASHVADLDDLIAHLQGPSKDNVVIVGHSLGAIVGLHYAASNPENIAGVALLGAGRAAGHIPAVRQRMLDLANSVRNNGIGHAANIAAISNFYENSPDRIVSAEAREEVRKAVTASDPEGYARTCEAVVDLGHRDPEYGNILAPVVYVAGDKDGISPIERSNDLSKLMGGKSWVEVVRSGHQPILEDLMGVRRAIDGLFEVVEKL
ncbi:Alpha/Beta hydrolase protein [Dendryphion nanum]|uniref:Alpha/Beta hydrolase protein n=1 Tax=Dendryphion nanum TaxID=256645 RepID=A0A9P9I627_9PLEO|nr:Alpha/Beta hydrolase protein [Dendryphion nanum]